MALGGITGTISRWARVSRSGSALYEHFWIDPFEQRLRTSQIANLTRREHHLDGIAERIDEDVNLGGQSAAGPADCLFAVFFRAPALC